MQQPVTIKMPAVEEGDQEMQPSLRTRLGVLFNVIITWILTRIFVVYAWFAGNFARILNWLRTRGIEFSNWFRARRTVFSNFSIYAWFTSKFSDSDDSWFTWREAATLGPTFFSTLFSLISMRYPHEDDKVLRARGVALWSLSCLYVFSFGLKVSLDYLVDHAFLFHYIARTASGNKVLYTKSVLHLVGFLISVLTIFNSVYNCFSKDPWTTYVVSITSGGLSFIYAVIQGYKSDKKHGLVETKGEERQGRMLKSCTDIPPRGRLVLHEIDEDAENFEVAPREGSQVPN